ncbi:hypothetical protein H072_1004 [Dactylellina haptotyla CBS 200.50]|uniref:Uncharacterized protein n=1 Tax=Dactylellina haptotyla (strain CBS 200.50) TaxID=1284197 RepID=S8AVF5_DACHA|nr:hypothetical protein H072_1004 [Dactylellina haptotyla CBS 200.50]
MISGAFISVLKRRLVSTPHHSHWRTPIVRLTAICPRNFTSQNPSGVAATIISEFQRANVRFTSSGVKLFEQTYAEASSNILASSGDLYELLHKMVLTSNTPDMLWYRDLNTAGVRQWRSYEAYKLCITFKVYKIWEALCKNDGIFKQLIDDEEKSFRNLSGCCMTSELLWWWLDMVVRNSLVERDDVDKLPEPSMLRDVVIGSGDLGSPEI